MAWFWHFLIPFIIYQASPFKKPIYNNLGLMLNLLACSVFAIHMFASDSVGGTMKLSPIHFDIKLLMIASVLISFVIIFFLERFIAGRFFY